MVDLKEMYSKGVKFVKELLRDTPIEVLIVSLGLGTAAALVSHKIESNRDKLIPVAFSEISQIEDQAEAAGKEVDTFTLYHAGLNDLVMKVLESWNDAWKYSSNRSSAYKKFGELLDARMCGRTSFRHKLSDLLEDVPRHTESALEELSGFAKASNRIKGVNVNFKRAWNERHIDNYHTEIRTRLVTHTDSKGNSYTTTETYTVQVYDDTTHTYNYNKNEGESASSRLDGILEDFDKLALAINMKMATIVQEENLEAIKLSRKIEQDEELTDAELMKLACTWRFGSNMFQNKGAFANPWGQLRKDADNWRNAKGSARDHKYKTTRHLDSGPEEYRVVKQALDHGEYFVKSIDEVLNAMNYVKQQVPQLEEKIRTFIGVMLYPEDVPGVEPRPKQMAYEIRDLAKEIYQRNFKEGFDVERYRTGMVVLYGVLGLIAGALLGLGVDRAGEKFNLWREKKSADNNSKYMKSY